jgi:hypothetical protein
MFLLPSVVIGVGRHGSAPIPSRELDRLLDGLSHGGTDGPVDLPGLVVAHDAPYGLACPL